VKVKSFVKNATIENRTPRSYDLTPGVSEIPYGEGEFQNAPEGMRGTYYSPQSDAYPSSIPTSRPGGLSDEHLFRLLNKNYGFDKAKFEKMKSKFSENKIIKPIVNAIESNKKIIALVRGKNVNK